MKKLIKDPLLHFLIIGLILFLVYGFVNNETVNREDIIIDNNDIESLTAKWEMQWKRPPTQEELGNLILQNIKQEVFYQEALKMNLDHNDEIIKRRLSQKMEFLSNDLATLYEPNDDELLTYFQKNSEKYMLPYSYSLYQVVFTNDNHENPNSVIESILAESKNLSFEGMKTKGDNLPFQYHYIKTNSDELASQLGSVFAEGLENLELNKWVGPVSSGFGNHIVYITNREKPILPELNTVQEIVLRDYQYDKQKEVNELIFKNLKKNYTITFDFDNSPSAEGFKSFLENKLAN